MGSSNTGPTALAGFVDAQGNLTDLFGPGIVQVFGLTGAGWQLRQELAFTLAEALGDCKILLLGLVKGALPAFLGEKGVAVSQLSGNFAQRLAQLPLESVPSDPVHESAPVPVQPIEVDTGIFRLDLAAAMKDQPRMTSRQILIPLMTQGGFTLLEVLCDHPPRWLDTDGRKLGYGYEAEPRPDPKDGFVVTLYPDACASGTTSGCTGLSSSGCSSGCSPRSSDEFDL